MVGKKQGLKIYPVILLTKVQKLLTKILDDIASGFLGFKKMGGANEH